MTDQVQKSLKTCSCCLQHEGKSSTVPLHPIVSTAPVDLLHVDFTSIEMTMEPNRPPKVANILVFQDHSTKHVMVYVTPNQTAKTVAKFLYQGYILIFGAPSRLLSDCSANFMSNIISKMCKQTPQCEEAVNHTLQPPHEWAGREVPSNYYVDDWEAWRR